VASAVPPPLNPVKKDRLNPLSNLTKFLRAADTFPTGNFSTPDTFDRQPTVRQAKTFPITVVPVSSTPVDKRNSEPHETRNTLEVRNKFLRQRHSADEAENDPPCPEPYTASNNVESMTTEIPSAGSKKFGYTNHKMRARDSIYVGGIATVIGDTQSLAGTEDPWKQISMRELRDIKRLKIIPDPDT